MRLSLKNICFGEVNKGTLKRLPFLGYQLLLSLLIAGFALTLVLLMDIGEHILGGNLTHAQDVLREWLSIPFMVVKELIRQG